MYMRITAATTQVSPTAVAAMMPFLTEEYGNPSSFYSLGQRAAEALVKARETVAECLGAEPGEIYFTSGGSEADNQAIRFRRLRGREKREAPYHLHQVRAPRRPPHPGTAGEGRKQDRR